MAEFAEKAKDKNYKIYGSVGDHQQKTFVMLGGFWSLRERGFE